MNTLVIDSQNLVETLFKSLIEREITILRRCYGLNGEKKTIVEIGEILQLTKERVRQIRDKALDKIRVELEEKKYLVHSTARYNHLEEQYAKLDEKFNGYINKTDTEILKLNYDILRLKGICEKYDDDVLDVNDYPQCIQILVMPIKDAGFSYRVNNCLRCYYENILDIVENWDDLLKIRNFGKKSFIEIKDFFEQYNIVIENLTLKEKLLARQIIERLK